MKDRKFNLYKFVIISKKRAIQFTNITIVIYNYNYCWMIFKEFI